MRTNVDALVSVQADQPQCHTLSWCSVLTWQPFNPSVRAACQQEPDCVVSNRRFDFDSLCQTVFTAHRLQLVLHSECVTGLYLQSEGLRTGEVLGAAGGALAPCYHPTITRAHFPPNCRACNISICPSVGCTSFSLHRDIQIVLHQSASQCNIYQCIINEVLCK